MAARKLGKECCIEMYIHLFKHYFINSPKMKKTSQVEDLPLAFNGR